MWKYFLAVLGVTLSLAACKKQTEKIQPTTERITESVYASGTVKSNNQYQVYATVSGLIQQILVKEGDVVKKGDPLFVIENELSKLQAENAKLTADFAIRNVAGDRLVELKGAINFAKTKMLSDSLMMIRQQGLWEQRIGSKVELEQRELAYSSAQNNYEAALLRYSELQKQLQYAAAQSQKMLFISTKTAKDFIVRSQRDGRVYSIAKEVGEVVNPQMLLGVVGAADDFITELQIDENDIVRIKKGQRVLLTLDSYKGEVFEASIGKIDPIMNERTRTFTVVAEFAKPPSVLYPYLTAEANILIRSKENALTIPRAYLISDSLVQLENKEQRRVVVGLRDYAKAEILSGLSANETIVKPEK